MIDDDYRYGDEWDWDQSDPRQYCVHGTFVGSWWGPDLMCWKCETWEPARTTPQGDDWDEVLL